jgi:hypothetical protein
MQSDKKFKCIPLANKKNEKKRSYKKNEKSDSDNDSDTEIYE